MKDLRKLLQGKYFLGILLGVSVISLTFSPVLAESEAQAKPDIKPLRIGTFSDRKILEEGEEIGIKVWIDSELIDLATVTVFFSENLLELNKDLSCQDGVQTNSSCEVTLPRNNPVNFSFTGKKVGKFNVLIQVSGENIKTSRGDNQVKI